MNRAYGKFLQIDEDVRKKACNQVKCCSPQQGIEWDKATQISNKFYHFACLETFSFERYDFHENIACIKFTSESKVWTVGIFQKQLQVKNNCIMLSL